MRASISPRSSIVSSVVSAGKSCNRMPSGDLMVRIGLPITHTISSGVTPYSCVSRPRAQTAAVIW
jgi:hypothetical protein